MRKQFLGTVTIALALGSGTFALADRNPVNESAAYSVDKDASRTSNMVQDGNLTALVSDHDANAKDGPAYKVKIDYDFDIVLAGHKQGSQIVEVPDAYFTEKFMADLRASGHYESARFKMDHEGYEDATTMDGHAYSHCDKVRIYDIKKDGAAPIFDIARAMLAPEGASLSNDIQNLEIRAHVFAGVPVLGAVKLDVSGVYSGLNVKAGADYTAP